MNSKDDTRKRTICLKSYVTDAEYQHIVEVSERTCLSVSELTRRVLLGHEIRSKVDQQVFLDILKVNADLGRLGGLLKLWLSDETKAPYELTGSRHFLENDYRNCHGHST